jgi:hypothetical protein
MCEARENQTCHHLIVELRQSARIVQLGIMGPDVIETDQEGLRNDDDGEQAAHVLETKYNLTMWRIFLIK